MGKPIAPIDAVALLTIALIWGVNNVLTMAALAYFPPMLFAGLRFLLTALVLLPFLCGAGGQWRTLLLIATLSGPVHFAFVYAGFAAADDVTPVVIAAQLWIPFSVALAAMFLGERVGPARATGVGLAFIGVAAMAFDPRVLGQAGALILIGAGAFVWACVSILIRRSPGAKPLSIQVWTAWVAVPALLGASGLTETDQAAAIFEAPWQAWAAVAFAGVVSSVGANALLFRLVQRYEVARTTPYLLSTPVFSAALGVAFLGDVLTLQVLIGGALAMAGVALCALAERQRQPRSAV